MNTELRDRMKELDFILPGDHDFTGGGKGSNYFDVKKLQGYPDVRTMLAKELYDTFDDGVICVAGSGYGGIPLATEISSQFGLYLTMVRPVKRNHGTRSQIEGYVPYEDDKLWVIEDVFNTGGSLMSTMEDLQHTQAKILGSTVVVRRNTIDIGYPVKHLFTEEDFK
jgi:orotate phosphoribosyltransferase